MAFKMKGYQAHSESPIKKGGSWWERTKRQFSSKNPYGFGDARGRGKSATKEQIKHQMDNPRQRGESYADWNTRIGSPTEKKTVNVQGLPGTGESAMKKAEDKNPWLGGKKRYEGPNLHAKKQSKGKGPERMEFATQGDEDRYFELLDAGKDHRGYMNQETKKEWEITGKQKGVRGTKTKKNQ